jgi:hypothetical protein
VSPRVPNPTADPIVARLADPANQPDVADVIELVGYIGPGRPGNLRIFPDRKLQRWLEVAEGAVVDSQRIEPGNELSRSAIWVDRQTMLEEIFEAAPGQSDGRLDEVARVLADVPFSTWNLIPETRLDAADLLGLIAYGEGEEETRGGYR